jgi:regulator of sigma E protease
MFLSVLKFVGILLEVLLIFNLLIIVHELGHFLAAKWRGLYIERFGIWFGKPLWEKKIGGIWYSLGSIPAGGFVKLPQLAPMEALEGQTEIPKEQLKPITPLDKIIVAFAGPLFSFMLAVVFAVIVWQVGKPVGEADGTTTVGLVQVKSPAYGVLEPGDVIKKIDDVPVKRWGGQSEGSVMWRIVASEGETVKVDFERKGQPMTAQIKPKVEPTRWFERRGLRMIGIAPKNRPMVARVEPGTPAEKAGFKPNDLLTHVGEDEIFDDSSLGIWAEKNPGKPLPITVDRDGKAVQLTLESHGFVVAGVVADSPASRAGLKPGDRIVAVDDRPTPFPEIFAPYVWGKNETPVSLTVERAGKTEKLTVRPEIPIEGGGSEPRPSIGIQMAEGTGLVYDQYGRMSPIHPSPVEQISDAVGAMVQTFKKITSPKSGISVQHMGGPVMMMRIYYLLFESPEGWRLVLWFSVILNVNLALLNMLPLPVLDGGHITLAGLEAIRKKPINTRVLEWVQTACALLIIGFMLFVTFFDVQDVFGGGGKKNTMRFKPAAAEQSAG